MWISVRLTFASPLFPQRGLNFTHSDQGAEVFHLCADLRHVQAAHVVDVLTQPSRLTERDKCLLSSHDYRFSTHFDDKDKHQLNDFMILN